MQPYQERVIAEKCDLDGKISKLGAFMSGSVFPTIDHNEQRRLIRQLSIMVQYFDCLNERIAAWGSEPVKAFVAQHVGE